MKVRYPNHWDAGLPTATAASKAASPNDEREYVMGLEKGLSVIEAFGMVRGPATLSRLAAITGHTKASVRRCLITLCKLGYALQAGREFQLAPRALRLGQAFVASDALTRLAQPVLEMAAERTRESASMAVLDGQDAVFVARATHRSSLSTGLGIGSRLPAYASATGRVLFSGQAPEHVEFILNRMARPALTPHTRTGLRDVLQQIEQARTQGYAVCDEELEIGLRSIAVPVRNAQGDLLAAMSLSVATSRKSRSELIGELLPELESARRTLASIL
jgi:IclR family transcriptional regulator, pca regulon regulatory protein